MPEGCRPVEPAHHATHRGRVVPPGAQLLEGPFAAVALELADWQAGVAVGAIGYLYSQIEGTTVFDFVADSLVNIGAGLIGSAVTFILFQSLFSGRLVDRAGFVDRDAKLQDRLDEVLRLSSGRDDLEQHQIRMITELTDDVRRLQSELGAVQDRLDSTPTPGGRRRRPLRSRRTSAGRRRS